MRSRAARARRWRRLDGAQDGGRAAPARVQPTGNGSLLAEWSFHAGRLRIAANLGALADRPPPKAEPVWSIGDPAADNFSLTLWIAA